MKSKILAVVLAACLGVAAVSVGSWDAGKPADDRDWDLIPSDIRANWAALEGGSAAINLQPVYNVKKYGAVGDGIENDGASLATAEGTVDDGGGVLYFPQGDYELDSSMEVSSNVTLGFAPGATISVATGVTLTIAGDIAPTSSQIFICNGTGSVVLSGSRVRNIDPRWWGAIANDNIDDSTAFQAAITASGATLAVVDVAPGIYDIATPLVPEDWTTIRGQGQWDTHLRATVANTDALFKFVDLHYTTFENLRLSSLNNDANAFEQTDLTEYTAYCRFVNLDIYKTFHTGIVGCWGSTEARNCVFGERGTAGTAWQCVDLRGGDSNTNIFTPIFDHCRFYWAQGVRVDGAVELRTGNSPIFIGCVNEFHTVPALYLRGVLGCALYNCNFENVQPGGAYNCLFDLGVDDYLTQGSTIYCYNTKFQNNGVTPWTALAYVGSACGVGFEGSQGALAGYVTLSAGPLYDQPDKLYFARNNRWISRTASTIGAATSVYTGQTQQFGQVVYHDSDTYVKDLADRTDTKISYGIKTVSRTISLNDDTSDDDYQFDDDQANVTKQTLTLTDILPAYATILDVHIRCFQTVTGSASMQIGLGTTSGGTELYTGSPDSSAEIGQAATGSATLLAAANTARSLYVSGTPGANWNTLDAGRWDVMITYIDYGAVHAHSVE